MHDCAGLWAHRVEALDIAIRHSPADTVLLLHALEREFVPPDRFSSEFWRHRL